MEGHSLAVLVRQYRREIAWSLNAAGLMLTVAAAITLYLYPPRFAPAYTESGEQKLTLVNPATSEGRAYAKQWAQYAWLGPLMLILGFSAQLAAATFDAPFWTRLSPRHDGPSRFKGERAMSRRPLMVSLLVYLLSTGLLGWATGRWSEVIYFLTGLILIWYTLETREVRLATLRQTALQIRPFLAIEYGDERKIWVHNVGNGVARDIKFHDVRLSEGAEGATGFLTVEWKPIDFIPKGEKRELHSEGLFLTDQERRERHADQTEKWRANFGPHGKGQVYEFITDYSDLSGTPYRAAFRVHKGHTEVLRDEQYAGDGAGHHERTAR